MFFGLDMMNRSNPGLDKELFSNIEVRVTLSCAKVRTLSDACYKLKRLQEDENISLHVNGDDIKLVGTYVDIQRAQTLLLKSEENINSLLFRQLENAAEVECFLNGKPWGSCSDENPSTTVMNFSLAIFVAYISQNSPIVIEKLQDFRSEIRVRAVEGPFIEIVLKSPPDVADVLRRYFRDEIRIVHDMLVESNHTVFVDSRNWFLDVIMNNLKPVMAMMNGPWLHLVFQKENAHSDNEIQTTIKDAQRLVNMSVELGIFNYFKSLSGAGNGQSYAPLAENHSSGQSENIQVTSTSTPQKTKHYEMETQKSAPEIPPRKQVSRGLTSSPYATERDKSPVLRKEQLQTIGDHTPGSSTSSTGFRTKHSYDGKSNSVRNEKYEKENYQSSDGILPTVSNMGATYDPSYTSLPNIRPGATSMDLMSKRSSSTDKIVDKQPMHTTDRKDRTSLQQVKTQDNTIGKTTKRTDDNLRDDSHRTSVTRRSSEREYQSLPSHPLGRTTIGPDLKKVQALQLKEPDRADGNTGSGTVQSRAIRPSSPLRSPSKTQVNSKEFVKRPLQHTQQKVEAEIDITLVRGKTVKKHKDDIVYQASRNGAHIITFDDRTIKAFGIEKNLCKFFTCVRNYLDLKEDPFTTCPLLTSSSLTSTRLDPSAPVTSVDNVTHSLSDWQRFTGDSISPARSQSKGEEMMILYLHPATNIRILIGQNDITKVRADCIVNAANRDLKHYGGVAYAIGEGAGLELERECEQYILENGPLHVTDVCVTTAGYLPCKMVMHTVGPFWSFVDEDKCFGQLQACILNCLKRAEDLMFKSIVFPAISTGIFGAPVIEFSRAMCEAIGEFCLCHTDQETSIRDIYVVDVASDTIEALNTVFEMQATQGVFENGT